MKTVICLLLVAGALAAPRRWTRPAGWTRPPGGWTRPAGWTRPSRPAGGWSTPAGGWTRPTGRPTGSPSGASTEPTGGSGSGCTAGSVMTNGAGCVGGESSLSICQVWSQEPSGYNRVTAISAPEACSSEVKFPVVIDLHGNGGQGNLQRLRDLAGSAVLVAPSGYERSWNIVRENSKAPDTEFLLELIAQVGDNYPQADMDDVTIVGTSNGAGMTHRLLIETPAPRPFHRVMPMVSSLGQWQYHDGSFWTRTDEASEEYDLAVVPDTDPIEMIYLHGTEDGTIPYYGGQGLGMQFWSAQEATFIWARQWGYAGEQIAEEDGEDIPASETSTGYDYVKYSYLGGKVVHYKVVGAPHMFMDKAMVKEAVLGTD